MRIQTFIDNYMVANGSKDPFYNTKAKYACVEQLAARLDQAPTEEAHYKPATLGDVCDYLDLLGEALSYYDSALEIVPDDFVLIQSKIKVMLKTPDHAKSQAYIETVLGAQKFMADPTRAGEVHISYLTVLHDSNQILSAQYEKTLDYVLTHYADNIHTHFYAASYHEAKGNPSEYLEAIANIVDVTRRNEAKYSTLGYGKATVAVIAQATELAIERQDKNKAWLFIAHLMNSDLAAAATLKLREAAMRAFPPAAKNAAGNQL